MRSHWLEDVTEIALKKPFPARSYRDRLAPYPGSSDTYLKFDITSVAFNTVGRNVYVKFSTSRDYCFVVVYALS